MKTKFIALVLSLLIAMPCVLHAEEIEIQLMEVIGMTPLPGDDPLDDSNQSPGVPPRPRDFRATINGTSTGPSYHPYMRRKNFWNLHYGLVH